MVTYLSSEDTKDVNAKETLATTMRITDPATGVIHAGENVEIAGTLTDETGAPVVGVEVKVYVDGVLIDTVTTGSDGRWSTTYTFPEGTHEIKAVFEGV